MEQNKYIIPRNVINTDDTFPFDFITHVEIEKRQIPYILVGAGVAVMVITSTGLAIPAKMIVNGTVKLGGFIVNAETASLFTKMAMSTVAFGSAWILSRFNVENQNLEQLLSNFIEYNKSLITFKCERGDFNAKNFKSGIFKLTIKE